MRLRAATRIACIALGTLSSALAQPAFDVASVKLCKDEAGPTRLILSAGHLQLPCLPFIQIIPFAYGDTVDGRWNYFPGTAISGGPSWIKPSMPPGDTYTIDARTAPTVGHDELVGPRLRKLLEDRFKLKVRREIRPMPVYALTVDKRGPKLKPFDGSCAVSEEETREPGSNAKPICEQSLQNTAERTVLDIHGITLPAFVRWLNQRQAVGRLWDPIIDQTSIEGYFDIRLEFVREISGVGGEVESGIKDALREQLGLRLERTTGPREFLVIEHIERPSEN